MKSKSKPPFTTAGIGMDTRHAPIFRKYFDVLPLKVRAHIMIELVDMAERGDFKWGKESSVHLRDMIRDMRKHYELKAKKNKKAGNTT